MKTIEKNDRISKKQILSYFSLLAKVLTLLLGFWGVQVQGGELRYRYVSLGQIEVPPNISFYDLFLLNDQGRVYGNAFECADIDCNFQNVYVASLINGRLALSAEANFFASSVNKQGTIGGGKLIDTENFITQAAVTRSGNIELIPPIQPDEFFAQVAAINDRGVGLVSSFGGDSFTEALALYDKGQTFPVNLDPALSENRNYHINNKNIISGYGRINGANFRGFRFNPATGVTTILNPLPSEPHSWVMDIDNSGNVLGYSFNFNSIERIGVWDKNAIFKTYFVEGIPEFPTISNNLLFNDENLIVITDVRSPPAESGFSYVIPKPGVRINLAELIVNLPIDHSKKFVVLDMNNRGDMLSTDQQGFVLLKRIED